MTRLLTPDEEAALAVIRPCIDDVAFLYLTPTGIRKALLDAVLPVRTLLKQKGIHDYADQAQRQANKVFLPALVLDDASPRQIQASLYRPETKKGDPRIWFSRLGDYAAPNDILALFVYNGLLHLLNLSRSKLHALLESSITTETIEYLHSIQKSATEVANELLAKLQRLAASGPLRAVCSGDTAIGRTIETALGITINSSKTPDYRGIELKSYRSQNVHGASENRATLFAQVPDWTHSRFKSSRELLDAFGYDRDGVRKLYCTVAIEGPNSQGLQLRINRESARLLETHPASKPADVVVWELDHLHKRLLEKHRATFWIKADSHVVNGCEQFILKSVMHTVNPSASQFDHLLDEGVITVDHLIKRLHNRVTEKGPLFKIPKCHLTSLFLVPPRDYRFLHTAIDEESER